MDQTLCRHCGEAISGKYCAACGEKAEITKITLHGLLHEVFHYFTHLDKGFGYTLKQLVIHPGKMQRRYIEGDRARHQKPFSMFFICGTISGLGYYFIGLAMTALHGSENTVEEDFFRHYFGLSQLVLLPLYSLLTWLLFKNQKYSYAETLIMMLYTLSFIFIAVVPINAVKLIFPDYENRIVEVIVLLAYNVIGNLSFYDGPKWKIAIQGSIAILGCFVCSILFQDLLLSMMQKH